jgi:hypothetical protein
VDRVVPHFDVEEDPLPDLQIDEEHRGLGGGDRGARDRPLPVGRLRGRRLDRGRRPARPVGGGPQRERQVPHHRRAGRGDWR